MNMDEVKGKLQSAFGKTEEVVGEAVGSQNLSNAGAEDRLKGTAKETWGGAKAAVNHAGDRIADHADATGHDAAYETGRAEGHVASGSAGLRDKIISGAEHLKDTVNTKIDNFQAEHPRRD